MSIGISNANNFHQYENREYIKDVAGKILNTNGYFDPMIKNEAFCLVLTPPDILRRRCLVVNTI